MKQAKFDRGLSFVAVVLLLGLLAACNKPVLSEAGGNDDDITLNLKKKKVLLIVLDGVVGASLEEMKLPTFTKIAEKSVYSYYGLIDTISNNGTTWADLLTGTRLNKHLVKTESFSGANFSQYPSFLKRLKDGKSDLRTVAITTLPLLATGVFGAEVEKHIHLENDDIAARDSAVGRLQKDNLDMLVVDFSAALHAGKSYGFGTGVSQYRAALQQLDTHIDDLIYTMEHRGSYDNEDWMVVITSTHGGRADGSYGGSSGTDRNVFSFYYNPQQKKTNIPRPLVNIPYEGNFVFFSNPVNKAAATNNSAFKFGQQDFTVEFRVKTTGGGSDPAYIGNKDWNSGGNPGWVIFRTGTTTWRVNLGNGTSAGRRDLSGGVINDDKWHMLSVTFNRKGSLILYQDGVQVAAQSTFATVAGSIDGPYPLVIGNDGTGNYNPTGANSINSYIADVRIWKTVLPADVIKDWQYLDITSGHPFYDNLVGYWKLNAALGPVSKDYSKTGADLVFTSTSTPPATTFLSNLLNPSALDSRLLTPGLVDHSFRIMTWMGMRVDYQTWGLDGKVWSGN